MVEKVIVLSGISQKGKNRINENGSQWLVLEITENGAFGMFGPMAMVRPVGDIEHKATRWISLTNDKDFKVI